ncbi:L-idonate 5-dehydrogenase [Terriglobus sp.]|uniref:L-idonate 5-dehydrogenase n=1 Tax=Terriglobus sp. TaxID=1889013 RepID=UPI003B00D429
MIAAVLHEPKKILLEEWEAPEPGPGQVLVRVRAGGICGSDLSYYFKGKSGDFAMRDPFVLGHELAGEVAAVGTDVAAFPVGQRVAVNPGLNCGTCRFCVRGMTNHCLHMRFLGSASVYPHSQGAFREYVAVAESQCVAIPHDFDFATASMAEPLAVTLHALRHAPTLLGARVLVVGCGPIGCLLVAAARRAGAHHLTAIDLAQPALDKAMEMRADTAVSATDTAQIDAWQQHRGTFDVVIEASGSPAGLDTALRTAIAGGTVLQVGNMPSGQSPVAMNLIMSKELRLLGSFRFGAEYATAVEEIVSGKLDLRPLMSHTFPLAEANKAFAIAQDRSQSMKVHLQFD